MQNMQPKYRRTKYFVLAKFQTKYVGLILALMFLTALICCYVVYYSMMITMGEKLATVYPQGRLIATVNSVNLKILFSLLFITPFVIVISVYLSHKIAGPIYRLEKYLATVASGDLSQRVTLRKGDEFVNIANGINSVVDSVKKSVVEEKQRIEKVISEAGKLKEAVNSNQIDKPRFGKVVEDLNSEAASLNNELKRYKV